MHYHPNIGISDTYILIHVYVIRISLRTVALEVRSMGDRGRVKGSGRNHARAFGRFPIYEELLHRFF